MRPILICPRERSTPDQLELPCWECHEPTFVDAVIQSALDVGGHPLCVPCATELLRGEIVADCVPSGATVLVGSSVLRYQRELRFGRTPGSPLWHELEPTTEGKSAPRWVTCPRCGAYKGDECNTGRGYCPQRIDANIERLEGLQTWAIPQKSPCHDTEVWLCWRSAEDQLEWQGVPCFARGCGKTHTFQAYASDLVEQRVPIDRLHPDRLEMTCWATEQSDPFPAS